MPVFAGDEFNSKGIYMIRSLNICGNHAFKHALQYPLVRECATDNEVYTVCCSQNDCFCESPSRNNRMGIIKDNSDTCRIFDADGYAWLLNVIPERVRFYCAAIEEYNRLYHPNARLKIVDNFAPSYNHQYNRLSSWPHGWCSIWFDGGSYELKQFWAILSSRGLL